jgi:predicted nuclease with TOPRIM domain
MSDSYDTFTKEQLLDVVEDLEVSLSDLSNKYSELLAFVSNFRLLAHSFTDELSEDVEVMENELIAEHTDDTVEVTPSKMD